MTEPSRYDPLLSEVMRRAAESYRRHDDDATRHWLEEAIQRAPWRIDIRYCLAGCHVQYGTPEQAAEEYEQVLQRVPDEAGALFFSAHWHRYLGKDSIAGKRAVRLERIRPDWAEGLRRVWKHLDTWQRQPVSDVLQESPVQSGKPAILVLGLVLNDDGSPRPGLIARLEKGLELYRRYPGAVMVVSGGVPRSGCVEAVVMGEWLRGRGVEAKWVYEEGYSRDIVENLLFSRQLLAGLQVDAVFGVTCAVNVRRTGVGLDILSEQYGLGWRTEVVAAGGETFGAFVDDGRDGLKLYRDSLRVFGIPMMASYPYLAER